MLFSSLHLVVLVLPVVLAVATRLRGQPLLARICAASAAFYAFAGHAWFLIPMAITTVLDYWMGLCLEREGNRGRMKSKMEGSPLRSTCLAAAKRAVV